MNEKNASAMCYLNKRKSVRQGACGGAWDSWLTKMNVKNHVNPTGGNCPTHDALLIEYPYLGQLLASSSIREQDSVWIPTYSRGMVEYMNSDTRETNKPPFVYSF